MCVGIALLKIVSPGITSRFSMRHLVCWLLGRHNDVKLGMCTSMTLSKGLTASWAAHSMVQRLGSRLIELELCETNSVWQVLFQLQALRRLRLSVIFQDASSADELPAGRKLPQLTELLLTGCTASVSSILVGTSLPQLKSLTFDTWKALGCINIDASAMAGLEQLKIRACKQTKVIELEATSNQHCELLAYCIAALFRAYLGYEYPARPQSAIANVTTDLLHCETSASAIASMFANVSLLDRPCRLLVDVRYVSSQAEVLLQRFRRVLVHRTSFVFPIAI